MEPQSVCKVLGFGFPANIWRVESGYTQNPEVPGSCCGRICWQVIEVRVYSGFLSLCDLLCSWNSGSKPGKKITKKEPQVTGWCIMFQSLLATKVVILCSRELVGTGLGCQLTPPGWEYGVCYLRKGIYEVFLQQPQNIYIYNKISALKSPPGAYSFFKETGILPKPNSTSCKVDSVVLL